jgi:transcriptional repressor NrdR
MRCPFCHHTNSRVLDTTPDQKGGIRRRRYCSNCQRRFSTYERPILATPQIVKSDGSREDFDRDKLLQGLRLSCAKRPVPHSELERLVGEIETTLQEQGKMEVPSRLVGDLVMAGLQQLDQVAYIRFATVYLGLEDLAAIRSEIDRLLEKPLPPPPN